MPCARAFNPIEFLDTTPWHSSPSRKEAAVASLYSPFITTKPEASKPTKTNSYALDARRAAFVDTPGEQRIAIMNEILLATENFGPGTVMFRAICLVRAWNASASHITRCYAALGQTRTFFADYRCVSPELIRYRS
jgi:hypothetical protein